MELVVCFAVFLGAGGLYAQQRGQPGEASAPEMKKMPVRKLPYLGIKMGSRL